MNFLPEKKYGVPSHSFVKKNVLCKKGDEITRFDGNKEGDISREKMIRMTSLRLERAAAVR